MRKIKILYYYLNEYPPTPLTHYFAQRFEANYLSNSPFLYVFKKIGRFKNINCDKKEKKTFILYNLCDKYFYYIHIMNKCAQIIRSKKETIKIRKPKFLPRISTYYCVIIQIIERAQFI